MRAVPVIASCALLVASGLIAGCAANSGPDSPAAKSAQSFVAAISSGRRQVWCSQLAMPFLQPPARRRLSGVLLRSCERGDLFALSGACVLETTIAGASVIHVSDRGTAAAVQLSSGAYLYMHRLAGRWLIDGLSSGTRTGRPPRGPCATP